MSGEFPQGRPRWEDAGARFVDDVAPWEQRKLWLLNGSHSLHGLRRRRIRGHETVEQAIADPVVRGWVEQWWDDAARHLPLPAEDIAAYRAALLERYANPRIRHLLRQIAADGSQKLPIRILPTVRAELAAGPGADGRGAGARRLGVPPARAGRAGRRRGRRGVHRARRGRAGRRRGPRAGPARRRRRAAARRGHGAGPRARRRTRGNCWQQIAAREATTV